MSLADSSSLRFWEAVAEFGTWMVIVGVIGEGLELFQKVVKNKWPKSKCAEWMDKREFMIETVIGTIFWMMVVLGLILEQHGSHTVKRIEAKESDRLTKEAGSASKQAGLANERAAVLESNNLVFSGKILELAHQYDLSTNALAEANARLAAIRPVKQRLIALLDEIDPKIMQSLRAGVTNFRGAIPENQYTRLVSLQHEPGAEEFILSVKQVDLTSTRVDPRGSIFDLIISLKSALAK